MRVSPPDRPNQPPPGEPDAVEGPPGLTGAIRSTLAWSEELLYIVVGLVLLAAAAFVVVGTVSGLISAVRAGEGAVNVAELLLDRILLALIVAELLHTLRFVVLRGQIVVEPFLFVGLIAVVRRILIVTAGLERQSPGSATRQLLGIQTTASFGDQLLELALLGFLALALSVAIFLVRRSAPPPYDPAAPPQPPAPHTAVDAAVLDA